MSDTAKTANGSQPPELDLDKLLKVNQLFSQMLGDAVGLMAMMPQYQHWRVADLKARLMPPIALRQCKILRHKGFPVAFVSWAWLSEDIEERLDKTPELPLTAREWRSGPKLRFIDVASPKGNEEEIKAGIRRQLAQSPAASGAAPGVAPPAAGKTSVS